jgi:hypothetical protein
MLINAFKLSLIATLALTGCAASSGSEDNTDSESAALSDVSLQLPGQFTITRTRAHDGSGIPLETQTERSSATLKVSRIPSPDELIAENDSVSVRISASVTFTAPTVVGGGLRTISGNVSCALGAALGHGEFVSTADCILTARDARGGGWTSRIQFDRAGKLASFDIYASHVPTFDTTITFKPDA